MGEETGTGNRGDVTIPEKLDRLIEIVELDKKERDKKIKFPKLSNRKMNKNYVLAIILRTNKQIVIKKVKIEDNMVYLKDNKTYHLAITDFVMRYKKYPVIILPEWDLQPLSIDELQGKTISQERLALPQKIIIQAVKDSQLNKKKSIKGILIIVGILAGAALIYFIVNSMSGKQA